MFGTKALLQAHIDECGSRYQRMAEQQAANHCENQSAIRRLGEKIDKFVVGALITTVLALFGIIGYLLIHGVPWKS